MNLSIYPKTAYENKSAIGQVQNKPNSNPNKPNLKKAKMNINSITTEDYRKNDDFTVRINKPCPEHGRMGQFLQRPKMSANIFITKDYENETALQPKKTNPIKPNFRILRLSFMAFYVKLLIEANRNGRRRGRPIKHVLGREIFYERLEN